MFGWAVERVETEDCRLCRRAGRTRTVSYLFPRFVRLDVSGDQRPAAHRTVHSASRAHGALRAYGGQRFGAGLRPAVFHRAKGRRGFFSQQGRGPRGGDTPLGGAEWICWRTDGGLAAAAYAVQDLCVC